MTQIRFSYFSQHSTNEYKQEVHSENWEHRSEQYLEDLESGIYPTAGRKSMLSKVAEASSAAR